MISIIIPVYNHAKELQMALASVAEQTYSDIEVIVVDDGSKSNFQIFKFSNFQTRCPDIPVRLVRQKHAGAPAARNRGLQEAKGEYVIFWDADVIGDPDMLEKMYLALQKHPEASYAYSDFRYGWKKMRGRPFAAAALKQNNYIHTTSLVRRADLQAEPWDESLKRFQDWDLWLTFLENNKTGVYVPECLFRAIPHRGGMSVWLPRFAYREPWRRVPIFSRRVSEYEEARKIVIQKHEPR